MQPVDKNKDVTSGSGNFYLKSQRQSFTSTDHFSAESGSLLLIQGDRAKAQLIGSYFEEKSYLVDYANDGATGLRLSLSNEYDAIIVDNALPGIDGIEVIRRIRSSKQGSVPILFTMKSTEVDDRISALDAGADGCICNPLDVRELEGRLRALLRRHRQEVTQSPMTIGDLRLDPGTQRVRRATQELRLSPVCLRLLAILMRESPRVVTRSQLERHVWGECPPDSDTLRSHLYLLRRTIDRPFDRPLLQTIRNIGYRLS